MNLKVAIIAPSKLPIPSVKGGAIETLSTHLLDMNELYRQLDILVISPYDTEAVKASEKYNYTKYAYFKNNLLYNALRWFSIHLYRLSGRKIMPIIPILSQSKSTIKKFNPDIIIVEGSINQVYQLSTYKRPIILHVHTDVLNNKVRNARQIVQKCTGVWAISEFIKSRIVDAGGPSEKIKVFKNAIDTKLFTPKENNLRTQLKIPETDIVGIYCGRLDPIKGVMELLRALKNVDRDDLTFLIVGGSNFADSKVTEYERALRDFVIKNNLKVIFTGYVPSNELSDYYSIADFSICPSICNEAAGLVILEARAMSLPVIASNMGGIPEYINPYSTILVDYTDRYIEDLAHAVHTMLNSAILGKFKLCANKGIEEFTLENYYNIFLNLLKTI